MYKRQDVDRASEKAVNTDLRASEWFYFEEYALESSPDGYRYVAAKRDPGPLNIVSLDQMGYYRPLTDHPDLILQFARLKLDLPEAVFWSLRRYPYVFGNPVANGDYTAEQLLEYDLYDYSRLETERNQEAARDWAEGNGALGLTSGSGFLRRGGEPYIIRGDPMGGAEDTVWRFVIESYIANRTLTLYEAATAPDGVNAGTIRRLIPGPSDEHNDSPHLARHEALDEVARTVETMVANRCYPVLRRKEDGIAQGWGFRDLLGAMWLQMMWLVIADSGRRCQRPGCNRTITIARQDSGELKYTESYREGKRWHVPHKYATRKDKKYCSDSCRVLASRARRRAGP
jgi:hypothetical protein